MEARINRHMMIVAKKASHTLLINSKFCYSLNLQIKLCCSQFIISFPIPLPPPFLPSPLLPFLPAFRPSSFPLPLTDGPIFWSRTRLSNWFNNQIQANRPTNALTKDQTHKLIDQSDTGWLTGQSYFFLFFLFLRSISPSSLIGWEQQHLIERPTDEREEEETNEA